MIGTKTLKKVINIVISDKFPVPRHSHSADYDKTSEKLLIFGGYMRENPKFLDTLTFLEFPGEGIRFSQTMKLSLPPRCRHASFIHRQKLYIYGGIGIHKVTKKISNLILTISDIE